MTTTYSPPLPGVPREGGSGLARDLFVLGLIPAYLLARQLELGGDLRLRDVRLLAGIPDGTAECEARLSDLPSSGLVGVTGCNDISHGVGHPPIVTWVWPLLSMRHKRMPRNLLRCQ